MRRICPICHDNVNNWQTGRIEIENIGTFYACGECLEKFQDFFEEMLKTEGDLKEEIK